MGDEIDLQKTGLGIVPLGESADGDLAEPQGPGFRRGQAAGAERAPERGEDAINGGGADLDQGRGGLRVELENAGAGEDGPELCEEGLQSAAASVPTGLPGDVEGVDHLRACTCRGR